MLAFKVASPYKNMYFKFNAIPLLGPLSFKQVKATLTYLLVSHPHLLWFFGAASVSMILTKILAHDL